MANDRLLSLLGIARKAGRLSLGFDSVCESAAKGEAELILTASDISEGTLDKLRRSVQEKVRILGTPYSIADIGGALGKSVRIISINDSGFAEKAGELLNKGYGED